jgi:hypothetical protein
MRQTQRPRIYCDSLHSSRVERRNERASSRRGPNAIRERTKRGRSAISAQSAIVSISFRATQSNIVIMTNAASDQQLQIKQ